MSVFLSVIIAFLTLLTSCTLMNSNKPSMSSMPSEKRDPAFFFLGPKKLKNEEIVDASSSGPLKLESARVIIDNDAAFDAKIQAIRSAKNGETIRLAYFIYSDDQSSSYFTEELLKASSRGVNIRMLLDYITNYQHLDLFAYLESESKGRIQVRFYNKPSDLILRDLVFMTQPCPNIANPKAKACSDYKWKNINTSNPDWFARLLLAGMYSHNPTALSTSILKGGLIDIKKFTEGPAASEEEQKQLLEFFKLVYDSRVKGDKIAGIKVMIALKMYADKLNPIMFELFGRLPIDQMADKSFRDWEHITDFIHHKILIVGNRYVQLGGRNIENSYHMKPNSMTSKYIFMDTDMAAEIKSGGSKVAQAYDDLWNFKPMTIDIDDIYKNQPIDFVMNPEVAKVVVEKCTPQIYKTLNDRSEFSKCVQESLVANPDFKSLEARMQTKALLIEKNSLSYQTEYEPKKSYTKSWKSGANYNDFLSKKDIENALIAYIENVHYDRTQPEGERERKYGNEVGREKKYGKYIHHLWAKSLENVCAVANEELKNNPKAKPKRVILHSAYFLPPAGLLRPFAKMMDGTWDCHNVHVTFLTNSFETTDLNYINVVARYEMLAFFQIYANRIKIDKSFNVQKAAKFDYFEYNKSALDSGISLHTKLSVLGDDVIIGSANADVRTYFMDTNNGFYLRNAKDFVAEYSRWVDSMLADPAVTKNLSDEYMSGEVNMEKLMKEDQMMLAALLSRWKLGSKLSPKIKQNIMKVANSAGRFTIETTQKILSKNYIEVYGAENFLDEDRKKIEEQIEMERKFNRFLQLL